MRIKSAFFARPHKALFLLLFQCFTLALLAQVRISGRVTTDGTQGAPNISVQIQNTNFGTTTDDQGGYTLMANLNPGTYQLVFTGIGFRSTNQSLQIGSATSYTVNAQLAEDAAKMDEVVVTGTSAGTTRRQLGNYISTVKSDELSKGATGNVLAALQGKTAGAQIIQNSGDPAGGVSVRLRGISSVNSSSEPLYIVDGVIVNNATTRVTNTSANYDGQTFIGTIGQNRLVDINPADIDRIEILNGAAAAAIYGSRANAGVVQIFTKRGRTGEPQISFSTRITMSELRKQVAYNTAPVKFGGSPDVYTQDIIQTPLLSTTTPVTRYNYQDYIFHTGIGTDNNVSISAGSERTKFFASASYFYNQGIIKNTDFQRFSFRANVDQNISRTLSLTAGLNYTNSLANELPDGNSFFSPMNSITIIGNIHDIFTRDALGNLKAVGERGRVNPVSVIEDIKQRQVVNRVIANAGLKFNPVTNLTFNYTVGVDNYGQSGTTFIPPFAYNVSPAFYGGGSPVNESLNGYASAANNTFFQINHELNGTYNFNISKDLASVTQVGYSVQYERNNYVLAQGRGLAPVVQTVTGASTILPPADERTEVSISGVYLQQNFKFKNNLFITGALRLDGSSVFGENQRNQLYKKISGSYIISGEDFWKNQFWNLFKIRAAYGESGNLTGIGAYSRFNTYNSNGYLGRTSFTSDIRLANEDVKPERQTELEVGTDLAFFNNRIGLSFNYYIKKVKDLLINRVIAPTNGFSTLQDNFGELENKGFELVLNASPVANNDLKWNVTAILNKNKNKAVRIGQALTLFTLNAGAPVAIIEGQPIGIFYGSFFAVDGSGNQVKNSAGIPQIEKGVQNSVLTYTPGRDANGQPSGNTTLRKILGDPNPDWTGSLVNELSFKRLNLRVQLDAVQGVDVWNADWRTRQGVGNGEVAEQEHRAQLPRGYIAGIYAIEEWRIDDGSFVKLREVSLSYNLGNLKAFKDLTLSLSGRNLISWDNYKGFDPEVNAGGQSTILRGIDFGAVPIPRTFSFGISTKF
ncbi:MAG: SusC/RagA family TonB-linked outer membrane protein [Chitinophagaceae bacterium]|nr:MAG: SusC/RagA family TonB-linked outer membrane protein [Chitinophagaceae bacterium]